MSDCPWESWSARRTHLAGRSSTTGRGTTNSARTGTAGIYSSADQPARSTTLALANGILGRLHLSGHLNQMTAAERDLVRSAVAAHRVVLEDLETLVPHWPLGLPSWDDDWVVLGLGSYLGLWHRTPGPSEITVPLPRATITPVFPTDANGWTYSWSEDSLTVRTDVPEPSARIIQVGAQHG